MQPSTPMTKDDWAKTYWFNSLQMITVINPKPEDWPFMVEMRHFMIKAGATERFPGVIANVYLDQMSKILAQDEEKLEYMSDPNLKKLYYDRLIVNVESLVNEYDSTPSYLKPATLSDEIAPWDQNMERARAVAPVIAPPAPEMPKKPAPVKPDTKEFEFNSIKFKSVTDEKGDTTFFKAGKETDEATFAKAASML